MHVDPSEGVVDEPLLYERGWGKKQSYVIAMGVEGAEDVTKVYVAAEDASERRQEWDDRALSEYLATITSRRRARLPADRLPHLLADDVSQRAWIDDTAKRLASLNKQLPGRISGPDDWKRMRQEAGPSQVEEIK